jgi:hypothetical protein
MSVTSLRHFIPFPSCRYNNIRQNSLPVEYALIDGEIEENDSLIREVLQTLTWNSESESLHLQYFIFGIVKFSRVASFYLRSELTQDIFYCVSAETFRSGLISFICTIG